MLFREWFYENDLSETVFYGNKSGQLGWNIQYNTPTGIKKIRLADARDLPNLDPQAKSAVQKQILNKLKDENWSGINKAFVVNSIHHNFTTYDKQMDELRNWPQGCRKLAERVNRTKQAYSLVKGIIDYVLPEDWKSETTKANFRWLNDRINFYKGEEAKLATPCPPTTWSLVGV